MSRTECFKSYLHGKLVLLLNKFSILVVSSSSSWIYTNITNWNQTKLQFVKRKKLLFVVIKQYREHICGLFNIFHNLLLLLCNVKHIFIVYHDVKIISLNKYAGELKLYRKCHLIFHEMPNNITEISLNLLGNVTYYFRKFT